MTSRDAATDGCGRLSRQSPVVLVAHRTKLMCTPRPLCLPLHSRHMKTPYDTLAHCGFLVLQSTHVCREWMADVCGSMRL